MRYYHFGVSSVNYSEVEWHEVTWCLHPWRKQTWWWNNQVEEAVREKRRCFKLWKAGGSRAAYNTAKRTSNRVVHQAKSEAEKVALQKIGLEMFIDLPSKCVVTIRMSWERNLLRMMQASCR